MKVRWLVQWLTDSVRLVGAMFYWNARKTAYIARGRKGHCPCQNQSDFGRGKMVACDAVLGWNEPARFRKVCPLLFGTDEGWLCSVPAEQVRPFWGRVVVALLVIGVGGYLAATLSVFAALRTFGHVPVSYADIAVPSRWSGIRRAQAQAMLDRATEAFLAGRLAEAHFALRSAQERDPRNYPVSLMLAQIAMFQGSLLVADAQFARLLVEHPAQAERTAVVYHDTLLSLYRLAPLIEFSLARARVDQAHAAVWVRSALFGLRSVDAAEVAQHAANWEPLIAALAPHAQMLLRAELAARSGGVAAARALLAAPYRGPLNPVYMRHQVLRAAELGDQGDAQTLLDFYGPVLGEFDQQLTQFELARIAGDAVGAAAAFQRLLRLPLNPARVEHVAAMLIAFPDAARFSAVSARIRREPALEAAVGGAALWAAGLVCGMPSEARYWQTHGVQPALPAYPAIRQFDFSSRDVMSDGSPLHVLNVVSLPREVIFALLSRLTPPTPSHASAATLL